MPGDKLIEALLDRVLEIARYYMKKNEARQWFKYHHNSCDGFEQYYNRYQEWFNTHKLNEEVKSSLGNCTSASTPSNDFIPVYDLEGRLVDYKINREKYPVQEEGNNPMFTTTSQAKMPSNGALAISVNTTGSDKSDAMIQRDYLLSELRELTGWRNEIYPKLTKMFNLHAPMAPRTSKELLAAITAGKYTVDQAMVDRQAAYFAASEDKQDDLWEEDIRERYFGITFTDLPLADTKGYEAAVTEYKAMVKKTERTIQIGTPADGLAALIALEGFIPSNAPVTLH